MTAGGAVMTPSAEIGDLIRVATPKGIAYLQYIGNIDNCFSVIRVFAGLSSSPLAAEALMNARTAYFFASDVEVLLEDPRFSLVGHLDDIPGIPAFRRGFHMIVEKGLDDLCAASRTVFKTCQS
jgi:hypothetical protein